MLGAILRVADCPLALSVPEAGDNFNQEAEDVTEAFQFRGQLQLPDAVIVIACGVGSVEPCGALKASELDDGCASVQGGWTTRLTVMVCGLPLAGTLLLSLPLNTTCPS
jgi:hypothetical protein